MIRVAVPELVLCRLCAGRRSCAANDLHDEKKQRIKEVADRFEILSLHRLPWNGSR
jgi:hypothetical protein